METRQRRRYDDQNSAGGPESPNQGGVEQQRQAARRLANAGREAVNNALTPGRSQQFIAATRQHGGQ